MSRPPESAPSFDGHERRAHPRIPAAVVPHLTARIAGGPEVRLVDLCKRGVQLETTVHMLPGSTVAIRFLFGDASMVMAGAVVRSTVSVLETGGGVTYHIALAFNEELTLCREELASAERTVAAPIATPTQADVADDYTMIVTDGRTGTANRLGGSPAG